MMVDAEELKHVLRGLLISFPPDKQMTVNKLNFDYKEIAGKEHPYKELGFKTFFDYLKTIPDTVKLLDPHSKNSRVVPVVTNKCAHLHNLVTAQKCATKGRKKHCPEKLNRQYHSWDRNNDQYHEVAVSETAQTRILNFLNQINGSISKEEFADFLISIPEIDPNLKKNIPLLCKEIRHLLFYVNGRVRANWHAKVIPDNSNFDDSFDQADEHTLIEPSEMDSISEPEFIDSDSETLNYSPFCSIESDLTEEDNTHSFYSLRNSSENEHPALEDKDKEDRESIASSSSSDSSFYETNEIPKVRDITPKLSTRLRDNLIGLMDKNPRGIWLNELCKKYEKEYAYTLQVKQHGCYNAYDFASSLPSIFYLTKLSREGHILLRDARNYKDDDKAPTLPKDVRDDIVKMIEKHAAITVDQLQMEYKLKYGKPLVAEDYNFASLDHMILHLEDYIKLKAVGGTLLLFKDELKQKTEVPEHLMVNHCPSKEDYDLLASTCLNKYPKEVCGKDFFIPEQELPKDIKIGSEISIHISQVVTPSVFYIQLDDQYQELEDMMSALNIHYNEKEKTKEYAVNVENLHVGLYCVCKYEYDKLWYRVRVTNATDKSAVKVRFIDYGTVGKIACKHLRYLSSNFTDFPTQGLCVRQVGMKPASDGEWTAKARDGFLDITNQNLTAKVVQLNQVEKNENLENDFPILDCHVLREYDRVKLSEILVQMGHAIIEEDEEEKQQEKEETKSRKSTSTCTKSTSSNTHSTSKRRRNKSQKGNLERQPEIAEVPTQVETNSTVTLPTPKLDPPNPINRAKLGPPPGFGPLPIHQKSIPPRYESPPDYVSATSGDRMMQSGGMMPSLSVASKTFVPRTVEGSHVSSTPIQLNLINNNITNSTNALHYQQPTQMRAAPYNIHPLAAQRSTSNCLSPLTNYYVEAALSQLPPYEHDGYPYSSFSSPQYQHLYRHPAPIQPSSYTLRTPCQRYPDIGRYTPYSPAVAPSPIVHDLPVYPHLFAHGQRNPIDYSGLQTGVYNHPTEINSLPVGGQSRINMPSNNISNYIPCQTPLSYIPTSAYSQTPYSADLNTRRYAPGLVAQNTGQENSFPNVSHGAPNTMTDRYSSNAPVVMGVLPTVDRARSFENIKSNVLNASNNRQAAQAIIDKNVSLGPAAPKTFQECSYRSVDSDLSKISCNKTTASDWNASSSPTDLKVETCNEGSSFANSYRSTLNDRYPTKTRAINENISIDVNVLSARENENGNADGHDTRSGNASSPIGVLAMNKFPESSFGNTNDDLLETLDDLNPKKINFPTTMKESTASDVEGFLGNTDIGLLSGNANDVTANGGYGNISKAVNNLESRVSELVVLEREPQHVLEREIDLIDFGEELTFDCGNTTRLMADPFEIESSVTLENPLYPVKVNEVRVSTNDNKLRNTPQLKKENKIIDNHYGLMDDDVSTFIRVPPPRVARSD